MITNAIYLSVVLEKKVRFLTTVGVVFYLSVVIERTVRFLTTVGVVLEEYK